MKSSVPSQAGTDVSQVTGYSLWMVPSGHMAKPLFSPFFWKISLAPSQRVLGIVCVLVKVEDDVPVCVPVCVVVGVEPPSPPAPPSPPTTTLPPHPAADRPRMAQIEALSGANDGTEKTLERRADRTERSSMVSLRGRLPARVEPGSGGR